MASYVSAGPADGFEPGTARCVKVAGVPVAVFNCDGRFYATDDTCTHARASLSEGEIYAGECQVECPLHGAVFDLATGAALALPAVTPVRTYPVVVEAGEVRVALE